MNPIQATAKFRLLYEEQYSENIRTTFDKNVAKNVKGINSKNLIDPRKKEYTQLFKARQRADKLGYPYKFYIKASLDYGGLKLRQRAPLPNQLDHGAGKARKYFIEKLEKKWLDVRGLEIIAMSDLDGYDRNDNHASQHKEELRKFLIEAEGSNAVRLDTLIKRFYYEHQIITKSDLSTFDITRLQRVISVLRNEITAFPLNKRGKIEIRPKLSCFGLPIIRPGIKTEDCALCLDREACDVLTREITTSVREKTGSTTPKYDRVKLFARNRKRKQRKLEAERKQAEKPA